MTGDQTQEHPKLPPLPEIEEREANAGEKPVVVNDKPATESTPARVERSAPAPTRSENGGRRTPTEIWRKKTEKEEYAPPPPPLDHDPDRLDRARRLFEAREQELAIKELEREEVERHEMAVAEAKREAFIAAELTKAAEALESARRAQLPQGAEPEPYVDVVSHLRERLQKVETENREELYELRHEVERLQETIRRAKRKLGAQQQALHEQTERSETLSEALGQVQHEHATALAAVREESQAHWHAREQALMRQVKKDYEALIDKLDDVEDRRLAKQEAARSIAALQEAASETDAAPRKRRRSPDRRQQPRKSTRSTKKLPPAKPRARKRAPRASR
jgi:hypothetical protein